MEIDDEVKGALMDIIPAAIEKHAEKIEEMCYEHEAESSMDDRY